VIKGQSAATERKVRGLMQLCDINLRIVKSISERHRRKTKYFHFDLHAGSGWNAELGIVGSPLAFTYTAEAVRTPYVMHAIDIDEHKARSLADKLAGDANSFVKVGDNSELALEIPDIVRAHGENPRYAYGSIFIDPFGAVNQTPWRELAWVMKNCPKLDVIINFPSTGMKRLPKGHSDCVRIDDLPSMLSKQHWLIRDTDGPWQFVLCIGRNFKSNDYKSAGFYHWGDDKGVDIRRRSVHTREELIAMSQRKFAGF